MFAFIVNHSVIVILRISCSITTDALCSSTAVLIWRLLKLEMMSDGLVFSRANGTSGCFKLTYKHTDNLRCSVSAKAQQRVKSTHYHLRKGDSGVSNQIKSKCKSLCALVQNTNNGCRAEAPHSNKMCLLGAHKEPWKFLSSAVQEKHANTAGQHAGLRGACDLEKKQKKEINKRKPPGRPAHAVKVTVQPLLCGLLRTLRRIETASFSTILLCDRLRTYVLPRRGATGGGVERENAELIPGICTV